MRGVRRQINATINNKRLQLIKLVKSREEIWNRNVNDFFIYANKIKIWQSIANELGETVAEVQRAYDTLRDQYRRELKKLINGKQITWKFFYELDFLRKMVRVHQDNPPSENNPPNKTSELSQGLSCLLSAVNAVENNTFKLSDALELQKESGLVDVVSKETDTLLPELSPTPPMEEESASKSNNIGIDKTILEDVKRNDYENSADIVMKLSTINVAPTANCKSPDLPENKENDSSSSAIDNNNPTSSACVLMEHQQNKWKMLNNHYLIKKLKVKSDYNNSNCVRNKINIVHSGGVVKKLINNCALKTSQPCRPSLLKPSLTPIRGGTDQKNASRNNTTLTDKFKVECIDGDLNFMMSIVPLLKALPFYVKLELQTKIISKIITLLREDEVQSEAYAASEMVVSNSEHNFVESLMPVMKIMKLSSKIFLRSYIYQTMHQVSSSYQS
ncbi:uncharacterized protein LOC119682690 [Teleopsis dalmanni]|uniref:uncharacterized protein LOC119682690 n=1 Tax=Teleopsis dalmanni TaxID=139649 RepID=UPI0018CCFEEB|nr:uncharacterized protein LOC119682690 [Teleopsis dalmanni]